MKRCVQLFDFRDQLYKIVSSGSTFFLIATSEQSICAKLINSSFLPHELPKRYFSCSSCFRKEAGSHGKDTRGIFRVHQFDKIEQYCVSINKNKYADLFFEYLLHTTEDFYKALGLCYNIVQLGVNDLNNFAYKKFDIEAWFSGSKVFKEIVSCTDCYSFQAIRLCIKLKLLTQKRNFIRTFNSTLIAIERVICCLVENYQSQHGVIVPTNLRNYFDRESYKYKIFF
mmetsp:Transcript_30702/g.49216  ORF Transcript_30702/g.49216 Transcript_30702/m.49216 type:complete len:227 (+) Transcript_30702:548-1228(+)